MKYYEKHKPTIANYQEFILLETEQQHFPSEGLYIGSLHHGDSVYPALIDLNAINGLCILYNNETLRRCANSCLEKLAWRIALVTPSHLCDILLYNGGYPGEVFSSHAYINQYIVGERESRVQFDGTKEDFKAIIDGIYRTISDRISAIHLTGKNNLVELNESLGQDARLKYLFILLSDFPRHQTAETIYKLSQIVETGAKAGVYVLMTWDMTDSFEQLNHICTSFNPQSMLRNMELLVPHQDSFRFYNSGNDELFNRFRFSIDETTITPSNIIDWSEFLNKKVEWAKKHARPSSIKQDFDHLEQASYEPVMSELSVTIGLDLKDKHPVTVRFNSKDYLHSFILGQSGSGKSVLLHNIITSAILKYSPEDLMLYLLDFKGVEFNRYQGLKHTKAVLVENSDSQMTLEVLRELKTENASRIKLFQREKVDNIDGYNKKYPTKRIPQILFVADECQIMFKNNLTGTERIIQQEISEILDTIATQGRSQGIHMLLATQQLDETDISGKILKNLTECFLLMSASQDSNRLVPDSSDKTSKQRVGIACYYHKKCFESQLQTFYSSDEELTEVIKRAQQKAVNVPGNGEFYFSGSAKYSLSENIKCIAEYSSECTIALVGRKISIDTGNVQIPLQKDFFENILIFGANKEEQATSVLMNTIASLYYSNRSRLVWSDIKVIDCLTTQNKTYKTVLNQWHENNICEIIPRTESGQLLHELVRAIKQGESRPTILAIICSEKFLEMKRKMPLIKTTVIESNEDISKDYIKTETITEEGPEEYAKLFQEQMYQAEEMNANYEYDSDTILTFPEALQYILEEGPMCGIHVVLQVDKPDNIIFEGNYCENITNLFKHKIILKSQNDILSSIRFPFDIDVNILSDKIECLRAYYCADGEEPILFTPYQMPNANDNI